MILEVQRYRSFHAKSGAIIVGFMANVGNVRIKRLQTFFVNIFNVFNVFLYFYLNVYYIYALQRFRRPMYDVTCKLEPPTPPIADRNQNIALFTQLF